jgi:hypothetical protein
MTERQVKIVLDGETGQAHPVDTGIPQGSPVAPILFVTCLSGIFDEVEREIPGIKGLSFADDFSGGRKEGKCKSWQREREQQRRVEAEELDAGVEEPRFLPTPPFMASAEEE